MVEYSNLNQGFGYSCCQIIDQWLFLTKGELNIFSWQRATYEDEPEQDGDASRSTRNVEPIGPSMVEKE